MIKLSISITKTNNLSINLEKFLITVYFFILKARQHTSLYKMYDKNKKTYRSSAFINISNKKKESEENSENNASTSIIYTYKFVI